MTDLKLARIPDRTPVKLTIIIIPYLSEALAAYADIYRETYGQAEPVVYLIPFMLISFLEGDRAFVSARRRHGS